MAGAERRIDVRHQRARDLSGSRFQFLHRQPLSFDRRHAGAVGRHRLANLRHRAHAPVAGFCRTLRIRADVSAHPAGGRDRGPFRSAPGAGGGAGAAWRLRRIVPAVQPALSARRASFLRRAGAVRRRARLFRSIRPVAAGVSRAAGAAGQIHCAVILRLHRRGDRRARAGRLPLRAGPGCDLQHRLSGFHVGGGAHHHLWRAAVRPDHRHRRLAIGARHRRHPLRARQADCSGRDIARSICRAAWRRGGAAAGLRARHSACWSHRIGHPAQCARRRRGADRIHIIPLAHHAPLGRAHVCRRRDLWRRHHRLRPVAQFLFVAGGAVRDRRVRHGERECASVADQFRHARSDARPCRRGEHVVYRCVE